jgi:hypothetical protein
MRERKKFFFAKVSRAEGKIALVGRSSDRGSNGDSLKSLEERSGAAEWQARMLKPKLHIIKSN